MFVLLRDYPALPAHQKLDPNTQLPVRIVTRRQTYQCTLARANTDLLFVVETAHVGSKNTTMFFARYKKGEWELLPLRVSVKTRRVPELLKEPIKLVEAVLKRTTF
jgi:hypothetical protein